MKIKDIRLTRLFSKFKTPYVWAMGKNLGQTTILVEVETDAGVVGYGETAPTMTSPEAIHTFLLTAKTVLLGQPITQITDLMKQLFTQNFGHHYASQCHPRIRLFDDSFSLDDVRQVQVTLHVEGEDGFAMDGHSSMAEISRDPSDLVRQTYGAHHQYPDGFMLMMGTLFAPTQDRDTKGGGFTHKLGDVVTISNPQLGSLPNTVRLSTECPPWVFGPTHLMRNLAQRGLL